MAGSDKEMTVAIANTSICVSHTTMGHAWDKYAGSRRLIAGDQGRFFMLSLL